MDNFQNIKSLEYIEDKVCLTSNIESLDAIQDANLNTDTWKKLRQDVSDVMNKDE